VSERKVPEEEKKNPQQNQPRDEDVWKVEEQKPALFKK